MKTESKQYFLTTMALKYWEKSHQIRDKIFTEKDRKKRRQMCELQRLFVQYYVYWLNKATQDMLANGIDTESKKRLLSDKFNAEMAELNLLN